MMSSMNIDQLIGRVVRHFKGNLYLVIGVGKDTEAEEDVVIYKALYGNYQIWVRSLNDFMSDVPAGKNNPTKQIHRFELYSTKPKLD